MLRVIGWNCRATLLRARLTRPAYSSVSLSQATRVSRAVAVRAFATSPKTAQPAFAFRNAQRTDLEAIVAMLADDDLGRGRESAAGVTDVYSRAFDEVAASPDNRIIVAEAAGKVVGCAQLTIIPGLSRQGAKRGLIESVRVASDARGSGLGEALIRHAIALAKESGCRIVQLTSDKRRTRAHEFYRRLGFTATHEGFKLELVDVN